MAGGDRVKPTDGEWSVSTGSNYYVTVGDEDIGKAAYLGSMRREEALANARLFAASKDLLAACIGALDVIECGGIPDMDSFRAAIAKARGDQ